MQIHELNNFSGTLGAGSYLAIDNGTDTGRISSQGLLASTEARIDAANDQITDVKSDLRSARYLDLFNINQELQWEVGSINKESGSELVSATRIRTVDYIDLTDITSLTFKINNGYKYVVDWFDSTKNVLVYAPIHGAWQTTDQTLEVPFDAKYARFLIADTSDGNAQLDYASQLAVEGSFPLSRIPKDTPQQLDEIKERTSHIEDFALFDDQKFIQYLSQSNFSSGEYYQYNSVTDTVFTISNSGYKVQTVEIPAGTYNYKNIQGSFSFLRNKRTNAVVSFNTLNGGIDANSSGTFTIDYEAIFYVTCGFYQTINMLSKGTLPTTQADGEFFIGHMGLRRVFRCGAGEYFTEFYKALEYAMQYENSILYVGDGTYDLVSELGSDYFANFDHSVDGWGIDIGNGIEIICSEGAKFTCLYEGDNTAVHTYFSPLNAIRNASDNNDFIIRNMNISAKNCRYILHDECAVVEVPYRHIIDSCIMHLDNSESLSSLNTRQCIGGGLGYHGFVEIKNSVFSCDGGWNGVDVVSYHNSSANTAKSKIVCKDNYCDGLSTFRFSAYGTQATYITTVLASNNNLGANISTRKESADAGDNVNVLQWNNVVRS